MTKARRVCKLCTNEYSVLAFTTRTGSICRWCKGAEGEVMTNKPTMRATMVAAQRKLRPVCPSVDPAVRRLGEILQGHAGFVGDIAAKAGVPIQCLRRYRRGERDPGVSVLRALLNTLGYDLVVVRRKETES